MLYARRVVMEQADREVKQDLGWAQDQVRSDVAIRRHWALVCAAFCILWWSEAQQHDGQATRGKQVAEAPVRSWSALLREVRAWLEPFVLLWRVLRTLGEVRPPRVLRGVLKRCRAGVPMWTFAT